MGLWNIYGVQLINHDVSTVWYLNFQYSVCKFIIFFFPLWNKSGVLFFFFFFVCVFVGLWLASEQVLISARYSTMRKARAIKRAILWEVFEGSGTCKTPWRPLLKFFRIAHQLVKRAQELICLRFSGRFDSLIHANAFSVCWSPIWDNGQRASFRLRALSESKACHNEHVVFNRTRGVLTLSNLRSRQFFVLIKFIARNWKQSHRVY